MRRRRFLALAGTAATVSSAGCAGILGDRRDTDETTTEAADESKQTGDAGTPSSGPPKRPDTDIPSACPVSTVSGYAPPEQPTPKSVETFVREYEGPYMRQEQFLSSEDVLTEATIRSSERAEYGYRIEAEFTGADVFLQAAIHAEPATTEREPAELSALDSPALVEAARRAAAEDSAVTNRLLPPRGETDAGTHPRELQAELAAVSGPEETGYVAADETVVQLQVDVREVHADYFTYSVLYYIDSRVVRRLYYPDDDETVADGTIVECSEPTA